MHITLLKPDSGSQPAMPGLTGNATIPYHEGSAERRARREAEPGIRCEFTRDAGDLHQYYLLRAQRQGHFHEQPPMADAHDDASHILVARAGRQVIAGGRLTVTNPRLSRRLPMEREVLGQSLVSLLPELYLEYQAYGEFSGMVAPEEFGRSRMEEMLLLHLQRKLRALGCLHGFMLAPQERIRFFRQHAQALNMQFYLWPQGRLEEASIEHNGQRLLMFSL